MLEETIRELDEKVEFLINRNVQYYREIQRLRGLLDEANSKSFASQGSQHCVLDNLKPLAAGILARINKSDGE